MNKLTPDQMQDAVVQILEATETMSDDSNPEGVEVRSEADATSASFLSDFCNAQNTPELMHNPATPLMLAFAAGQMALKQGWTPAQFVELLENIAETFALLIEDE